MPPTPIQAWLIFPFGDTRRDFIVEHPDKKPAAEAAADAIKNSLLFIVFPFYQTCVPNAAPSSSRCENVFPLRTVDNSLSKAGMFP